MNLVTRRGCGTYACGGLANGRFLFLVPWRHVSVIGTSHDAHEGTADALTVTRWDLEAFLADAREAFPHAGFTAADVRLIHRGLLPMVSGNGAHVNLLRESAVVDHSAQHAPGVISMFGVRYTTARHTAAQAIDAVFRAKGVATPPPCRTDRTPVAGGSIADKESFLRGVLATDAPGVLPDTLRRLAFTYGTAYDAVLKIIRELPVLGEPLGRHCPVTGAEILHAAQHEAADQPDRRRDSADRSGIGRPSRRRRARTRRVYHGAPHGMGRVAHWKRSGGSRSVLSAADVTAFGCRGRGPEGPRYMTNGRRGPNPKARATCQL